MSDILEWVKIVFAGISALGAIYTMLKDQTPGRKWKLLAILIIFCIGILLINTVSQSLEKKSEIKPNLTETLPPVSKEVIGKKVGNIPGPLFIYPQFFDPSEKMGDIGDVVIIKYPNSTRFSYTGNGTGPHEWEFKYIDRSPNSQSSRFGGVMYLNPPNNYGDQPGWDLRGFNKTIKWEARSIDGTCNVEFVIGGIRWKWVDDVQSWDLKYPDSLNRRSLGIKSLTENWQEFSSDLSGIPEEEFEDVIGGFGWVISLDSNQESLRESGLKSLKTNVCVIEIQNIQYS